jgi:hypothetical protein
VRVGNSPPTVARAVILSRLSPDGAFIRGLSPLELHEVVDMVISGPEHSITVKARVGWTSNQVPPKEYMPRGVGVEFINISDDHREVRLVIVGGDGAHSPESQKLQSLSCSLGIRDSVTFVGTIEHEYLSSYYNSADLLVLPSH